MPTRPYPIQVTLVQQAQLQDLRRTCGENGYLIFPVADWYARCEADFLATPKNQPNSILIVRPTIPGAIEIRSYVKLETHHPLRTLVYGRKQKHTHVYWKRLWLPGNRPNPDHTSDWWRFIPDRYHDEVRMFTHQKW